MIKYKKTFLFSIAMLTALGISACGGASDAGKATNTEVSSTASGNASGNTDTGSTNAGSTDGKVVQDVQYSYIEFDDLFEKMEAEDIDGNKVDSQIFKKADVTMINIWGTFCSPCITEMPDIGEINRAYQTDTNSDGSLKFQVIGLVGDALAADKDGNIYMDSNVVDKAKDIVEKTSADYLHIVPTGNFGINLMGGGRISYFPSTIFVDKEGDIIETSEGEIVIGAHKRADWEKLIKEVIKDEQD
ncbi:MAG: TlpA disulfide reductase family protein [Eubacteriales bacterium]|nr:TlpA disulfide reductase family protein [Eubacteriales bacterium]